MLNVICNYVYIRGNIYNLVVCYILVGLVICLIYFRIFFYVLIIDDI
jgi:hypothetical protein